MCFSHSLLFRLGTVPRAARFFINSLHYKKHIIKCNGINVGLSKNGCTDAKMRIEKKTSMIPFEGGVRKGLTLHQVQDVIVTGANGKWNPDAGSDPLAVGGIAEAVHVPTEAASLSRRLGCDQIGGVERNSEAVLGRKFEVLDGLRDFASFKFLKFKI